MSEKIQRFRSLQDPWRCVESSDEQLAILLALRAEEFIVQTFSLYGLKSRPTKPYWVERDKDGNFITHYGYDYNENLLKEIANKILVSKDSTSKDKLNARHAISMLAFKSEVLGRSPDPWKLAAIAAALATIAPTPKQRHALASKNAQIRGKTGGSKSKRNQALQSVIDEVAKAIDDQGKNPSASAVWRYFEKYQSHFSLNTGNNDCDDLYVDGDAMNWTDAHGVYHSIQKRSLEPYIREAKKKLSNSP